MESVTATETTIDKKYAQHKMKLLNKHGVDLDAQYDAHKQLFVEIFSGEACIKTITDYEKGIDAGCNNELDVTLDILGGYYCFILGDCVNALRFWERSSNMGNINATCNIGILYYWVGNYEEAIDHYLKAMEKGCVYAIRNIIMHYLTKDIDLGKVKLYFGFGSMSDRSDPIVCKCWGEYYKVLNDYGMAMYFFERANELGCETVHVSIVDCCVGLNNMTKALEHFDKALEYGDFRVLKHVSKIVLETHHDKLFDVFKIIFEHDDCMGLYDVIRENYNKMICWKMLFMLKKACVIKNKNNTVIEHLMEKLESDSHVHVLKNKVREAQDNDVFDTCPICLSEQVLCVKQYCGHPICYCCYEPKMVCYYRCPVLRRVSTAVVTGTDVSTRVGSVMSSINSIIISFPTINPFKLGTLCLCWLWIYYNKRVMA